MLLPCDRAGDDVKVTKIHKSHRQRYLLHISIFSNFTFSKFQTTQKQDSNATRKEKK